MRFGLVGTSFWAREVHAAGIRAADEAELVGVWGRDRDKTRDLAGSVDATAYDDFSAMLDDVDAVSFSVPPHVQVELAMTAAAAGRHLLLEKPIATSPTAADALVNAVTAAGVSSVVFLTSCYTPERREWAGQMDKDGPWRGADAIWLASAFAEGSPFDTPWRHEKGALWDVGPHDPGQPNLRQVHLIHAELHDELRAAGFAVAAGQMGENVTTRGVDLLGLPTGARLRLGDQAVVEMPQSSQAPSQTFAAAVGELARSVETGRPHRLDAAFGRDLVALLARAEELAGPPSVV